MFPALLAFKLFQLTDRPLILLPASATLAAMSMLIPKEASTQIIINNTSRIPLE